MSTNRSHCLVKIMVACPETATLLLCPHPVSRKTGFIQKFRVLPRLGIAHIIHACELKEFQEFLVCLHLGRIVVHWHDPLYIGRDSGRAKMAQHADPFISLLDIKITQVFKAFNGVVDSLFPQMVGAQADPLACKFRLRIQ